MRYRNAVVAALLPAVALANGGPVAWTGATGAGSVAPRSRGDVRLVSEDLTIRLDDDGRRFHVRAEYRLDATAAKGPVLFGVPLEWPLRDEEGNPHVDRSAAPPVTEEARAAAAQLTLSVAGRAVRCELVAGRVPTTTTANDVGEGWCVAELVLPTAADVRLVLAYAGELRFEDEAFTSSALVQHGPRHLAYRLDPAGGWAGLARRLRARLQLGAWAGLVEIAGPPGWRMEGNDVVWDLADADLAALGAIEASVLAAPVLRHRELVRTDFGGKVRATASSTLTGGGKGRYDAARLVDRDPATAWCEGVARDGVQSWVELRFAQARPPASTRRQDELCPLEGFVLVPGYAKSPRSWTGNGRIRRYAVSACEPAEVATSFELPDGAFTSSEQGLLAQRFDASAILVSVPPRVGFEREDDEDYELRPSAERCVRLRIEEVAPGSSGDTCVSEFRPVFNCDASYPPPRD